MKLPGWPSYDADEIAAAAATLQSGRVNYWTGNEGKQFEAEFAAYHEVAHGIALANGTISLDLALKVLDIGPSDEVIVTPRTFLASVSAVVNSGATPVFAEVDLESQNITANSIEMALSEKIPKR